MVTESKLFTETINFINALLQILSNDTHSFNLNYPHPDAVNYNLRLIKDKAKVKPALQNPSSHPSIEMDPSNHLSSISPALYWLSTDCTARIKQWTPISDTLLDPNIAPY